MWPQLLLAASNLFGFWALKKAREDITFYMVLTVMVASTCMHLSESKHNLEPLPPFYRGDSSFFLNIDRFVALAASFWFLSLFMTACKAGEVTEEQFVAIFTTAFLGFCCMLVGELVMDQALYTALQLVWHAAVYSIMYRLA